MTIDDQLDFKKDLRALFQKYGVDSGGTFFIHGGGLHVTEVHVTRQDELIASLIDDLCELVGKAAEVPVQEFFDKKH